MTTLYGIPNCDTVKKARKWLEVNGIDYCFHDLRADGVTKKALEAWAAALGWESLVNRRSTTWRQLPESEREALNKQRAIALLQRYPTLIKRPVLEHADNYQVGFKDEAYRVLFG